MKSIRWMIGAWFAFAAARGFAQQGTPWRVYQAADGLPESVCSSVTLGPRGTVWARHVNEPWVSRLDGFEVRAIPAPGSGNGKVYESANGQIWALSAEGLQEYRDAGRGWIAHPLAGIAKYAGNGLDHDLERIQLCPTRQNQVLLLLPEALVACNLALDGKMDTTPVRLARQTGLQVFTGMALGRDGGLWIAGTHGLARLPGPLRNLAAADGWQEFPPIPDGGSHDLRAPAVGDDGGVTVLAETADQAKIIAHFDGRIWSVRTNPWTNSLLAWGDGQGGDWVATPDAVWRLGPGDARPAAPEPISAHHIFEVATESNGVFWLATSDGLFRYAPLTWRAPADAPRFDSLSPAAILSRSNRLWILSETKLARLESNVWETLPLPPGMAPDAKQPPGMFPLPNGNLALYVGGQFLEFNPQTGGFTRPGNDPEHLKPAGNLQDGALCVQHLGRLEVYDGTNFGPFPFPQPGTNLAGEILFSLQATNGTFWIGATRGMARYDGTNWKSFASSNRRDSDTPLCILEPISGKIWVGMQDQIMRFDGANWTAIRAGFFHIHGMVKARDGSVWVASENGLQRYCKGAWNINGVGEGLPGSAVQGVCEDAAGQIWALTGQGIRLYHPDADPDPPKSYVQPLSDANTVREGGVVGISFSGQDKWKYTDAERLLYSCRLDGKDWSRFQEQRSATFINLAAGKHTFEVLCMDRNWNIDSSPAGLAFTVTVPWYEESRLVFIASVGVAVTIFFAGLAFNRHLQLKRSYEKVEAMVALRARQLEVANRELFHSQKMNALGTLAAGIAHDFNNILSIIKGSAQIIEENLGNPDKIRTRTDRIRTVVEQGAGIVHAMLGFSRSSERQLTLCDLDAIVRETITLLGDRFLRDVEVQYSPPPAPLPAVLASKDFIQQILLNFIFNAAEAMTEKNQVLLAIELSGALPASPALKPAPASRYLLVAVRDFGSGIGPEIMPRIFEPFFTTKSLSTRRGTGLGLSMVYELARQMDCGLAVDSTVGLGSVFTLIIPVRETPAPPPDQAN